jgi:hypothetical protein
VIEKWIGLLGKAIVQAFLEWAGVKDLDDLLGKAATAIRAELAEDLSQLDDIPEKIIAQVADIPNQILGKLPEIINQAIAQLNPFR